MRYRNHEGYADPTAGAALANIAREEQRKRQNGVRMQRNRDCKDRTMAYKAHQPVQYPNNVKKSGVCSNAYSTLDTHEEGSS